mmetsp:Transcript_23162/g.54869  ORF Transcript_23162/g.54869 Transcript_23162/m.54869 type:complete len:554 (-) Transcript_23162:68-1729(-)
MTIASRPGPRPGPSRPCSGMAAVVAAALAAVTARRAAEHDDDRLASLRRQRPSGGDLLDLPEGHAGSSLGARRASGSESGGPPRATNAQVQPVLPSPTLRRSSDIGSDDGLDVGEFVVALKVRKGPTRGTFRWAQALSRAAYETPVTQLTVAAIIAANFVVSLVQAQIAGGVTPAQTRVFDGFELFFTVAFAIELVWNMFSNWLLDFWLSGWNVFDFVIVIIALLSISLRNLPGISVLRLFRAFRVFRLFRKIESLRSIIEGVLESLPAVGNAFVVLGILMGIWSIIGVEFFREYADEEFGNFSKAMFTCWQMMALDGWSDVARPLIYNTNRQNTVAAPIYFVSFTFVAAIVMSNVVIAILLDNYLRAIDRQKEEKLEVKALEVERAEHLEIEQRRKQELADSLEAKVELLSGKTAAAKIPALVSSVLAELCDSKVLMKLPRDELLDLAAVLFASPLGKQLLLSNAHAKVLEGKALGGTSAGDLLLLLAAQHDYLEKQPKTPMIRVGPLALMGNDDERSVGRAGVGASAPGASESPDSRGGLPPLGGLSVPSP